MIETEPALIDPGERIFTARVRWLDEPEGASAAAIELSERLGPLIGEWLELVRTGQRERQPRQMDKILTDLGPMPDPEDADGRAFWATALINPLPALGVCREIRPRVLEATDGLKRVEWVHAALADSVRRMRKMPPGPFEVEPPPGVQW